ncbi:hypothetical protein ACJX0J_028572 [Zea mays]
MYMCKTNIKYNLQTYMYRHTYVWTSFIYVVLPTHLHHNSLGGMRICIIIKIGRKKRSVLTAHAVKLNNFKKTNIIKRGDQDARSKENPENNPDCTTVYVGNLGHEVEPNYYITITLLITFLTRVSISKMQIYILYANIMEHKYILCHTNLHVDIISNM